MLNLFIIFVDVFLYQSRYTKAFLDRHHFQVQFIRAIYLCLCPSLIHENDVSVSISPGTAGA